MKNKKKILVIILMAVILIGGGIIGYFWYKDTYFVSTEDARISANTVNVTPQIPGRITSWSIAEGDVVQAGATLGWQDTNSVANSSGINASVLNQIGSMTVSKAELVSPISGQVIKSSVQTGQLVSPGQTVAIIADTRDLYVSANIEETKVSKLKVGQSVDITIDSLQGKKYLGKLAEIGKATLSTFSVLPVQSSNGNFTKITQLVPVKIRFPVDKTLGLVPGMSVNINIHVH
ncbi:MAG: HlyD family efflux transporter periplasmic adaptor subunit [Desulfitobacteriaceae bacterium]